MFSKDLPSEKKIIFFTLLATFIYELALCFQGFNLTDEGYALTAYQQIFNNPSSIGSHFIYYLTDIAGGIWNFFFGCKGIVSFRIFNIIIVILTIYFTYLSTKKLIKPIIVPMATCAVLLMHNYGIIIFHHNYFTALLVSIAVYFIHKGLCSNSRLSLFTGAFIVGINIFTRISNVTMLSLGILLLIGYCYEKNGKTLVYNILYSISGLIAGIISVILLMYCLGHLDIFRQTLSDLFNEGSTSNSTHGLNILAGIYINNYINIYTSLAIYVFSVFFCVWLHSISGNVYTRIAVVGLYSLVMICFILNAFNCEKYYAVILFPILVSCWIDRKEKSIILINYASLIILFFLPLGSDHGVRNMGPYCVWLASFMSVWHVYRFINYQKKKKNNAWRILSLAFGILYIVYGLYFVSRYAYYDRGSRLEKCYRANNPKFTVYTSKERAKAMEELLSALHLFVGKGDTLFCFESLPMVHYLTETIPYMENPWPWTYNPENFRKHLHKACKTTGLPVVLRQKCQPLDGYGNWTVPDTGLLYNASWFYQQERTGCFEQFIRENNYKVAWENELFIIYIIQ